MAPSRYIGFSRYTAPVDRILATTTPTLPGYEITEVLGIIYGMSVRTRGLGGNIIASLEALAGGRVNSYLHELRKARDEALSDLIEQAERIGADAVVGVDFDVSQVLEQFIVVTATGTAVRARRVSST